MGWPMVAMAGFSALGGLWSSRKQQKEMKYMRRELQRQREFAMERWEHYVDTYGDLEKVMVGEAETGVVADIAGVSSRAAADTALSFGRQRDQQRRQMMSFGLDPTSGRYQGMDREMGLGEALAESHNVGSARENERQFANQETFNRRFGLFQQGRAMGESAARDVQASQQAMASMYGQNANQYGEMANNMFANAGFLGAYSAMGGEPGSDNSGSSWNMDNTTPMQTFQSTAGAAPAPHPAGGLSLPPTTPVGHTGGLKFSPDPTYLNGYN